jgi:hypothetical protein
MVNRWNRMFLRTLRTLRALRRDLCAPVHAPAVVVNNPGQVNIAAQSGQQVGSRSTSPGRPEDAAENSPRAGAALPHPA